MRIQLDNRGPAAPRRGEHQPEIIGLNIGIRAEGQQVGGGFDGGETGSGNDHGAGGGETFDGRPHGRFELEDAGWLGFPGIDGFMIGD